MKVPSLPLVRAVARLGAGEVVAAHDAGEAAALGARLNIHELTFLKDVLDLQLLAELVAGRVLGADAQLLHVAGGSLAEPMASSRRAIHLEDSRSKFGVSWWDARTIIRPWSQADRASQDERKEEPKCLLR